MKLVYHANFADERPFLREFEGIQKCEEISRSHPSQLAILHVGKNDAAGCFYYVMELADPAEPVGSDPCSVISMPWSPFASIPILPRATSAWGWSPPGSTTTGRKQSICFDGP